jgi:hypothetical protein
VSEPDTSPEPCTQRVPVGGALFANVWGVWGGAAFAKGIVYVGSGRADYVADYSTSSPAIANGVLYVACYDTPLYAIRTRTGSLLLAPSWNGPGSRVQLEPRDRERPRVHPLP